MASLLLPHATLRRMLLAAGVVVCGAGVLIELIHAGSHAEPVEQLVWLLSLSYEANLPTWYSSALLLACALAVAAIALASHQQGDPLRWHWSVLSAGFVAMSIDEAIQMHEHLGGLTGAGGVLYFDWVIPATALVAAVALVYLPFLRALPAATRRRFLLAGTVYLAGAVLMELPLGYWTETHGDDNLTYALIDAVEESLEIAGASMFLLACRRHAHPEPSHAASR